MNLKNPVANQKVTAGALAGAASGVLFILLAAFLPEVYSRIAIYPGAEAHITTLIIAGTAWYKRENP